MRMMLSVFCTTLTSLTPRHHNRSLACTQTQIITHILPEFPFTSSSSSYLRFSHTGNLITYLFRGKHFTKDDLDTDGNLRSIKCWCSPSSKLQEITVASRRETRKKQVTTEISASMTPLVHLNQIFNFSARKKPQFPHTRAPLSKQNKLSKHLKKTWRRRICYKPQGRVNTEVLKRKTWLHVVKYTLQIFQEGGKKKDRHFSRTNLGSLVT